MTDALDPMTRPISALPAGAWRWAALGFVVLALCGGRARRSARPDAAQLGGPGAARRNRRGGVLCSLCGLAARAHERGRCAPRGRSRRARQCRLGGDGRRRRGASTATMSIAAWRACADGEAAAAAGTGAGGRAFRRSALPACAPAPPKAPRARKVSSVGHGIELVAAVRPLKDGQTAWWFAPRLSAPAAAPDAAEPATEKEAPRLAVRRSSAMRRWASRSRTATGASSKPMPPSTTSSAAPAQARTLADLIDAGDRAKRGRR